MTPGTPFGEPAATTPLSFNRPAKQLPKASLFVLRVWGKMLRDM
jgi:hypothetical protein